MGDHFARPESNVNYGAAYGPHADSGPGAPPGQVPGPAGAVPALRWEEPPEGPVLVLLDQTRLPQREVELVVTDVQALVLAIRSLAVRGAPLLGLAGAYGVALAAARGYDVEEAAELLAHARPTAVNLGYGVRRALAACREAAPGRRGGGRARRGAGAARGGRGGQRGDGRSTVSGCWPSWCRAAATGS